MRSKLALPPKSRLNQRQIWALRLLPVTAAVGPNFVEVQVAGGNLFLFRLLVLTLLVLTIGSVTSWGRSRIATSFFLLALGWTIWSGFSLLWAPDVDLGLQETLAIGFGLAVGVVMFNLGLHRESHLDALLEGWMMAYALAAAFAIRELATGIYLPGEVAELYGSQAIEGIAISFFESPNNYAAFILLAVPFLLLAYSRARTTRQRWLALLLLASTPVMAFFSTSRLGLLGIAVQFVVYAAIGLKSPRQLFKYLALAGTVVFLIGTVFWSGSRTANDVQATFKSDYAVTGSDTVRWHLTLNGMWMTWDSGLIGVGAGGYAVVTATEYVPYFVDNITDPHNFWIEVASQYGLLVFLAFTAWVVGVGRVAARSRRLARSGVHPLMHDTSLAILVGLTGYLFATFANSSFLTESSHWVFLTSLAALGVSLELAHSRLDGGGVRRRSNYAIILSRRRRGVHHGDLAKD